MNLRARLVALRDHWRGLRAAYHAAVHGDPLMVQSAKKPYCIEWRCPCGVVVGESQYPPNPTLERKRHVHPERRQLEIVKKKEEGAA